MTKGQRQIQIQREMIEVSKNKYNEENSILLKGTCQREKI